jgi:hypothetical protein
MPESGGEPSELLKYYMNKYPGITPDDIRVLKFVYVVNDAGLDAPHDEVRDLLVLDGMTEDEAKAAIKRAEELGIMWFSERDDDEGDDADD